MGSSLRLLGLFVFLFGAALSYARPASASEDDCTRFNARLGAFHKERAAEYADSAQRHRDLEEALLAEASNARRLQADLKRQAARSRDMGLRRHLAGQARAAGEAAASAERRLHGEWQRHREEEERFKDLYKIEARALLAVKPAGCAVKGPER